MKILILRPDHIGDMLLTTPFLSSLRTSFVEADIDILCGSWAVSMLENNPNVDKIHIVDFPWLARGSKDSHIDFFNKISAVRKEKYDIVINLRKAAKTAIVAKYLGRKSVYGFDVGKSKWAHTHKIHYRTDINIADLYLEFVKEMGGSISHNGLEIFYQESEITDFENKYKTGDKFVVIAPGAGYKEKYWDNLKWSETINEISRELKIQVYLIGGPGDNAIAKDIESKLECNINNFVGKLSLRESSILVKKASAVVSVDSAAMHIASAVKTPVIALFGPTNPAQWGPYSNGKKNIIHSKVKEFKIGSGSTNKDGGMELIEVDEVVASVKEILI